MFFFSSGNKEGTGWEPPSFLGRPQEPERQEGFQEPGESAGEFAQGDAGKLESKLAPGCVFLGRVAKFWGYLPHSFRESFFLENLQRPGEPDSKRTMVENNGETTTRKVGWGGVPVGHFRGVRNRPLTTAFRWRWTWLSRRAISACRGKVPRGRQSTSGRPRR